MIGLGSLPHGPHTYSWRVQNSSVCGAGGGLQTPCYLEKLPTDFDGTNGIRFNTIKAIFWTTLKNLPGGVGKTNNFLEFTSNALHPIFTSRSWRDKRHLTRNSFASETWGPSVFIRKVKIHIDILCRTFRQKVALEPPLLLIFLKHTIRCEMKKLGNVIDLGDPNLDVEWVVLEKISKGEFWGPPSPTIRLRVASDQL